MLSIRWVETPARAARWATQYLALIVHVNMAPKSCVLCQNAKAILRRPKTGQQICKDCFFKVFETEVHNTITEAQLFKPGDRVAIGASGGKGVIFSKAVLFDVRHSVSLSGTNRFNGARICHENA